MPEETIELRSNAMRQPGIHVTPALSIDDDIQSLEVEIDRITWTGAHDSDAFTWFYEMSTDGGPFIQYAETNTWGGERILDNLSQLTMSRWAWTIPVGINRQVRFTVDQKVRLRASVTLHMRVTRP